MSNGTLIRHPTAVWLQRRCLYLTPKCPHWISQFSDGFVQFDFSGMERGSRAGGGKLTSLNLHLFFTERCTQALYPRLLLVFLSSAAVLLSLELVLPFDVAPWTCFGDGTTLAESCSAAEAFAFNNSRQIKPPFLFLAFSIQSIKPDGLWRGIVCAFGRKKSNIIHIILIGSPGGTWWCEKDELEKQELNWNKLFFSANILFWMKRYYVSTVFLKHAGRRKLQLQCVWHLTLHDRCTSARISLFPSGESVQWHEAYHCFWKDHTSVKGLRICSI